MGALLTREKLGSTGIGRGIAIPHGRMSGAQEPLALVLVSETPINFDAIDNRPVDIFVALIVPEGDNQQHLKTLATIADKLKIKNFVSSFAVLNRMLSCIKLLLTNRNKFKG
ncbi:PTS system, nitrogen regulatory IIA component [Pseudoalteromonas sp. BSi20480]|nr:PTS system, nitrogen regulatory IIA component [Pseudoalteromonas sp. BSi20480]